MSGDGGAPPETPAPAKPPAAPQPYQAKTSAGAGGLVFFAGVLLFVIGLFWRLVEEETGWVTSAWIFGSIVMMLVPLAWNAPDWFAAAVSRRGTAVVFVGITVVLGLAIAAFVGWLTSNPYVKPKLPALDLTKFSRYTLSEETTKLLDRVEGTVFVTYLVNGRGDPSGQRDAVIEQIRVFEASSRHIRFAEVDSVRRPDEASRILTEQGVPQTAGGEDTDLIVLTYAEPNRGVTPGKHKEIKVEEWAFQKESVTGGRAWLGEGVLADAIYELVFQKYKAYATGGHGEHAIGRDLGQLKQTLVSQNIDVASEPLLLATTGRIPDDCEILLVIGPTAPFTGDEAELVSRWLETGKTLLFTVDVAEERSPTGLEDLLQRFGIATRTNYEVIAPRIEFVNINDRTVAVPQPGLRQQFPVYGMAYADHPAVTALRQRSGLATFFNRATYLELDDKAPEGVSPEAVCSAPSEERMHAMAIRHERGRTNFTPTEGKDKLEGKLVLIATSTRKPSGGTGQDARVIVSGDTDVFTDQVIQHYPANLDLARGLVQWGLRREGLVAVSERTLEDPFVVPTAKQKRFAFYWPLAVVFLPLIFGGLVWWARRR